MNKRNIISAVLAAAIMTSCGQKNNNFTINGDFTPSIEAMAAEGFSIDSFYLADYVSREQITEKYALQDGKISVSGKIDEPRIAGLMMEMKTPNGVRTQRIPVFLEAGNIVIKTTALTCRPEGSPLNDAIFEATDEISKAKESGDFAKAQRLIQDYILHHHTDITAVMMLTALPQSTIDEAKNVLSFIGQCSQTVQQHPLTVMLSERMNKLISRPKKGDKFIDFAVEYDGKTTHLSDYVGRGQYVLVDFWASWCGPCRAEIPNIIAVHKKYSNRNFTALGVAVKDNPAASLQAIADEGISYPQILNAGPSEMELYGFDGIPYIILFGPDGTILATDLRGNDIDEKLSEIFENK